MIGASPVFLRAVEQAGMAARSDARVLIIGESGTGKELLAAHIHENSPFAAGPFIKVNCAAIPTELIESELFGHEKGSFTGAAAMRRGKFELADGGTLFLDEVGDLHAGSQAKLLRVLQEGEFHRVGGEQTIRVTVRVVSATNRDLSALVAQGKFREDLYYRVSVVPIRVPSLRERPGDIRPLADYFLDDFCSRNKFRAKTHQRGSLCLCSKPAPGRAMPASCATSIERMAILTPDDSDLARHRFRIEVRMERESGPRSTVQQARESAERDHLIACARRSQLERIRRGPRARHGAHEPAQTYPRAGVDAQPVKHWAGITRMNANKQVEVLSRWPSLSAFIRVHPRPSLFASLRLRVRRGIPGRGTSLRPRPADRLPIPTARTRARPCRRRAWTTPPPMPHAAAALRDFNDARNITPSASPSGILCSSTAIGMVVRMEPATPNAALPSCSTRR